MNGDNERNNLPVPRDDRLPVLLPGIGPEHERVPADYRDWFSLASQRYARGLAIGPDGAVWLATDGGIICWAADLSRFSRYSSEHGLPGNAMIAVAVAGDGQPWAVHATGLLSYLDGAVWKPYEPLGDKVVNCLSVDSVGKLWVATGEGVYRIAAPWNPPVPLFSSNPDWAIAVPSAVVVTDETDVWLCTARGVYHHDGADWQKPREMAGVLTLARQGDYLWLGRVNGLLRIDLISGEHYSADNRPRSAVTALAVTHNGVWAACGNQVGLATEWGWQKLGTLTDDQRVTGLAATTGGTVWIATHTGLAQGGPTGIRWQQTDLPPEVISLNPEQPPVAFSNLIQALAVQCCHDQSFLWIGTPQGLFRLDLSEESWRAFTQRRWRDVRVLIKGGDEDELWAASWEGGLHSLKGRGVYELIPTVPRIITALAMGLEHTLWVAVALGLESGSHPPSLCSEGIYRGRGSEWTLAVPTTRLRSAGLAVGGLVQAVAQAQDGRLWIGTSAGLFICDPTPDALPKAVSGPVSNADIRVLLALAAPFQTLWAGATRGLYRYHDGVWTPIPDFENRSVTALAWDKAARTLWVGTDSGLLQLGLAGKNWSIGWEWTRRNSGLAADTITALTLESSPSGETRLWIGTPYGLSRYCHQPQQTGNQP